MQSTSIIKSEKHCNIAKILGRERRLLKVFYNYFRDYDAATGRYIQSDPIGMRGGINTYRYAVASPIVFLDSLGLACFRLDAQQFGRCIDFVDTYFPEGMNFPDDDIRCKGGDMAACARDVPLNEIGNSLCFFINLEVGSCDEPFLREPESFSCEIEDDNDFFDEQFPFNPIQRR